MTERKKSWREIDQSREKGRTRSDPLERNRERASGSAAYGAYKSKLDKLFAPGGAELPESLKEKLGPVSEDTKARRERLSALQQDPGPEALRAVVEANDPLPEDPRLLMSLLDTDAPDLLVPLLERLTERIDGGARVNGALLRQRLQAVDNRVDDGAVSEALGRLRAVARL
jgi:hypothetical protein